jgi:DHA2 family multidrug resistance protein
MLIPNFLGVVRHLRPEQSGDVLLTWTALPLLVVVPAAFWLLRRIDARMVAVMGLTSFAIPGCWGLLPSVSPTDRVAPKLIHCLIDILYQTR